MEHTTRARVMAAFLTRFPALAFRDYRIFWVGQFVSLVGTWMQNTVQPYLAYRITGQPVYLGLIGFAGSLPALLLMLPGGVLVEHLDKRKTVIVMQSVLMAQAFVLALLALSGMITVWHIIALSFVAGVANSVEITARQAMMIELVGRSALPNAIALNSTVFNLARVIGPSMTAPFLVFLGERGEGWAFFANGVSFLFVIVGLLCVRTRPQKQSAHPHGGAIQEFREGQRYIRSSVVVALLILMAAVPGFFGFTAIQQIPVFARDIFHQAGDTEPIVAGRTGALMTAQGAGALTAATLLATFSAMKRKGVLMTIGQFAFGGALTALAFSRSLTAALPLMVLIGWGSVTQLAMTNTLVQLLVPNELRGRVISTYLWALQGVAPFGSLFIGVLAQHFGAPAAVLFGGAVCLLTVTAVNLKTPHIRRIVA
ncbi:MAG: MFS transporter [Anaerolineae bacterium]|nr:MFS transporter [Thermoflexales bacterium]MDW8406363.1 MFS transporter [Anaerolineae bacterium]